MGLQEKQAMNEIQEKSIPKYQTRIKEHGIDVALKVDWTSIPQNKEAIERCGHVLGELTNKLWDLGQNQMAKDEFSKTVKSVTLKHDASISDPYGFNVKLNGDDIAFTANFETFTMNNTKQNFRKSIEEIL